MSSAKITSSGSECRIIGEARKFPEQSYPIHLFFVTKNVKLDAFRISTRNLCTRP
ncbi:hypothetical protein MBAV_000478 [Candidatus Magnetobacterium bavaricum]|uniref:Uncharacterized protein n=1 Tax=Candidatus Magnetobacterium bavaricum TaxID=29290 RepID=A0A0F3GZE3_9BACT|nr:hypothetical protein MBAV_000478 [Candidatus Magnetobacterium bavaricum]